MKITIRLLLVIFLFVTCSNDEDNFSCSDSRYTCIPDKIFEQSLIELGIDKDGTINGQVLTSDVSGITELVLVGRGISDLTGIEDFTALTLLDCYNNQLTSLDVRNGNNINFTNFDATGNSNLNCVSVDDATWATANWTNIDAHTSFSPTRNYKITGYWYTNLIL